MGRYSLSADKAFSIKSLAEYSAKNSILTTHIYEIRGIMKYSSKKSRRHRNPHNNDGEKNQHFFAKSKVDPTPAKGAFFQPKLTIGAPGDKYEQEADAMADQVVNHQNGKGGATAQGAGIQQKEEGMISRMGGEEEMKEKPELQREGEEEKLDQKPELQAQGGEEELKEKPELQRAEEEDMAGAAKQEAGARTASAHIAHQVKQSQGKGQKLPTSTQQEMSAVMGHDFSDVNIHTGKDSEAMNKELKAQAFTHQNDVFFNEGKYNPESSSGKHLLAHELTHVVQQNKSEK